jgi:hypothetical protein
LSRFYAGEENGLMCHVDVLVLADEPVVVVAPVSQLACIEPFDARNFAAYRKRRVEAAAITSRGGI